jgi:uncharacterized membrane protein YcjF (UPF0283 family)
VSFAAEQAAILNAVDPRSAKTGQFNCLNFMKLDHMNKKYILTLPFSAGVGTAIYQLLMNGFSDADWYRVATVTVVTLLVASPIVYFSQPKN